MTVAELVALLSRFPPDMPVEILSTDGPDYGWIDIGPHLGPERPYAGGKGTWRDSVAHIQTTGLTLS